MGDGVRDRPAWMFDALCSEYPPATFFPDERDKNSAITHVRRAQMICARCPVIDECAKHALDNHEMYGVWGGYSERDRRKIWRGETVTRMTFDIDHGTYRGYEAHRRQGIPQCDACYAAMQARSRSRRPIRSTA